MGEDKLKIVPEGKFLVVDDVAILAEPYQLFVGGPNPRGMVVQLPAEIDLAGQGNVVILSAEDSIRQDHIFIGDIFLPRLVQLQTTA